MSASEMMPSCNSVRHIVVTFIASSRSVCFCCSASTTKSSCEGGGISVYAGIPLAPATRTFPSRIINLEWQQINMQRRVAWIHPEQSKSNQAIGVALNDTACRMLKRQIGSHHKWVFVYKESCTKPDGTKAPAVRKMRYDANTAWRAALKRAGIEDFRFHDLRHTWASWLVQAGVPISVLQEMGGSLSKWYADTPIWHQIT